MKILVIEDDQTIANTLKLLLSTYNYTVDIAKDGEAGLQMVEAFEYDLFLLDVVLPKLNGINLCQQLRAKGYQSPILLLTGQGEGRQKATALNAGADDYVVKPFDAEELIARVQALLRRSGPTNQPILTWGNLSVDPSRRKVAYCTHLLSVTPKEYAILEFLLRNPHYIFSSRAILDHVWSSVESPTEEAVRVHIKELRQKLRTCGAPKDFIKTVHSIGYRLNPLYSSFLASQVEQQPTAPQIAELKSVNEALRLTLEELHTAQEELQQQNEELSLAQQTIELERQRYQNLFEFAPDGYFVTDLSGVIQEANRAASDLLHIDSQRLIGKPLAVFVIQPERSDFYLRLNYLTFAQNWEVKIKPRKGEPFPVMIAVTSIKDLQNEVVGLRWSLCDIRYRKQVEQQLQTARNELELRVAEQTCELVKTNVDLQNHKARIQRLAYNIPGMIYQYVLRADGTDVFTYVSPGCRQIYELEPEAIQQNCRRVWAMIHPEDVERVRQTNLSSARQLERFDIEFRLLPPSGCLRWIRAISQPERQANGDVVWDGFVLDISDRKQAEFILQQQLLQEQVIGDISQDIRRSLELNDVLFNTVERIRDLLHVDRVIIFRFRPDWQGEVIMESVGAEWTPILSTTIFDPCFSDHYIEPYRRGRISTLSDIDQEDLEPCYVELLKQFQVKANLVVPILQTERLWGLLIAHQCSAPRQWQATEIDLLRQLATQVGIAIQQSELYGQTRYKLLECEQIQSVLEESEERFRALSTAAPIGICQTNADGVCLYTNTCWQEMSGLTLEDCLGNDWLQAVHPEDRATLSTAWTAYLQGDGEYLPEFRLLTPQGEVRWILAQAAAMKSSAGEITGYVKTYTDITDRKLAEQKIREQAALLDIASDAIFVRDLDHYILYWNQGAERIYGWTAAEAISQKATELLQNDVSQISVIMQILFDQGTWRGETHKVTKTGKQLILEERWTLIRDEAGQPKSILAVNTDITEKKQLEAQFYHAQRLESLGTLASGIAHDLNNVLTPILAVAQLIRSNQQPLNEPLLEMLQILENSAKQGAKMVKQILTFARGTEGKRIPLQVTHLLQEVVTVIQQVFPKSIEIRQDIPTHGIGLVLADPTHLHQVLMNLCVNARDAMTDGGVLTLSAQNCFIDELSAQMTLDAHVGDYVLITVTDTGTGIPPELHDRIFDPFFTTKAVGQGTGLGLSTVLGIIRSYSGFLHVSSEVNQGTQFKVYLPLIETSLTENHQTSHLFEGNRELILIIDDNPAVLQTNRSLLENHHYQVITGTDGIEAIALYTQHQNDIKAILIDTMMPNMDGVTAIRTLRKINSKVRIIAVSGLSFHEKSVLAAGADIFLPKPYNLEDLLKNLHTLLETDVVETFTS